MKLTDTLDEQAAAEEEIEKTKPPIPLDCRHLDVLLYTPFRYRTYAFDSRFRRRGSLDGVFYASEKPETAIAEQAFRRLLFFADSPETPWPANPTEYTSFEALFATRKALDLTVAPLTACASLTDLSRYAECQRLADAARAEGVEVIRSKSVRDPSGGANISILRCAAFARSDTPVRQTWHIHLDSQGVRAHCENPWQSLEFGRDAFADDPRLAGFAWQRV